MLVFAAALTLTAPPDPVYPDDTAHQLTRWVNAYRTRRGLVACKPDRMLMRSARFHARHMSEGFGHNHGGSWLENVAVGYTSVRGVMHGWHGSYGHQINMVDPKHRYIGCARYGRFWCLRFSEKPVTQSQYLAARYVIPAWSTGNYDVGYRGGRQAYSIDWTPVSVNGTRCYRVRPLLNVLQRLRRRRATGIFR